MSADWARVSAIVAAAASLAGEAREAYVVRECAGDPALEREVRSLLAHHATDAFLEPGTAVGRALAEAVAAGDAAAGGPGDRVGAWRLVRPLGEGGMGVVWLAERADGEFTQRGALKLIRRGFATEAMVRRFRRERQILAALEHPNLARLIDGGDTPEGLPYLVMEYVEGEPLLEWARAHARTVAARLRLFLALCDAVEYAHQRFVLHRDLKPGNVLVTPDGVPRLLDFGVASIVDGFADADADALRTVNAPMTPEYASPEQLAGGEASAASDQYSLGVLLFELLTGERPFSDSRGAPTTARPAARPDEAPRPSTRAGAATDAPEGGGEALRRRLAGDLDTIVLRALQYDPARRYASVGALADDVRRHLSGHPVLARPDSAGYRAGKFVARNRLPLALATLAFVALAAGLAASIWQAAEARRESALATRRLRDVQSLANTLLFDVYDGIENMPGAAGVRLRVVRTASRYLDALAAGAGRDTSLRFSLADAYERLGTSQGEVQEGDPAKSFERARALRESLLRDHPGNEHALLGLVQVESRLGSLSQLAGDFAGGLAHMRRAADYGGQLLELRPADPGYRLGMLKRWNNLGNALALLHRLDEAQPPLRLATEGFAKLAARDTGNAEYRRLLGMARTIYAGCLYERDEGGDATLAAERLALQSYDDAARRQPGNLDLQLRCADAHARLSSILARRPGEADSSVVEHEIAQRIAEAVAAADPRNRDDAEQVSVGRLALALAHAEVGRMREAARDLAASGMDAWWRSDPGASRLQGSRLTDALVRALLADAAARETGSEPAWRAAAGAAASATALASTDTVGGSWSSFEDSGVLLARLRARADSALARPRAR